MGDHEVHFYQPGKQRASNINWRRLSLGLGLVSAAAGVHLQFRIGEATAWLYDERVPERKLTFYRMPDGDTSQTVKLNGLPTSTTLALKRAAVLASLCLPYASFASSGYGLHMKDRGSYYSPAWKLASQWVNSNLGFVMMGTQGASGPDIGWRLADEDCPVPLKRSRCVIRTPPGSPRTPPSAGPE